MEMRSLQRLGLFAIGCVVGAAGFTLRDAQAPVTALHDRPTKTADGDQALACTPQAHSDDVFFISCGGIY